MSPLSRNLVYPVLSLSLCLAMSACMASSNSSADSAAKASAEPAASNAEPTPSAPAEPAAMTSGSNPAGSNPTDPDPADPSPANANASEPARGTAQVGDPVGDGPFGQFIVKYRDGTTPLTQTGAVQPRLDQTAQRAGLSSKSGLKLTWKHRMGINADVFSVSPALDRAEALRLMQTFAADPDVQFIEPDNHMSIGPIIRDPAPLEADK